LIGPAEVTTARKIELVGVEFIRLFFTSAAEEEIAFQWATRLASLLGPEISQLRPETTLADLLAWAARQGVDSMDFVCVFEPELRLDFAEFLENAETSTFRQLVDYARVRSEASLWDVSGGKDYFA
jgi:hypothetical protein